MALIGEDEVGRLSEVVEEFYRSAGTSNGFNQVPPLENMDLPVVGSYWFRADFEDPEATISSEIMQWRGDWPRLSDGSSNNYLGSITIHFSGLIVYEAKVNRFDTSKQANRRFVMKRDWLDVLVDVTSRYPRSSSPEANKEVT